MSPGPLVRDFGPNYNQANGEKPYLDVEELVTNVQNLYILTKPVIRVILVLDDMIRWKHPGISLLLLSIWNIGCLLLGISYQLVIVIFTVFLVAGAGYIHRETRCLSKVLPSTSRQAHDFRKHTERDDDQIQEFKAIMWQTNLLATRGIVACNKIYAVLEWEDPMKSLRVYGVCLFFSIAALMLPVTWSTAIVVNYFFIGNMIDYIFHRSEKEKTENTKSQTSDSNVNVSANPEVVTSHWDSENLDSLDTSSIPTDDSDSEYSFKQDLSLDGDSYKDFEIVEPPDPPRHDVEITPHEDDKADTKSIKSEGSNKDNTPSTCAGCGVTFTSILKRRKNCSNCGNHFCGKCCSYKVLRSLFGATSPAAQTETVSVCHDCYEFLTVTSETTEKDKKV